MGGYLLGSVAASCLAVFVLAAGDPKFLGAPGLALALDLLPMVLVGAVVGVILFAVSALTAPPRLHRWVLLGVLLAIAVRLALLFVFPP